MSITTQHTTTRRGLLRQSVATATALAAPWFVPSHVLAAPGRPGANDRVEIGVIGVGVRGKYLIANMPPQGRVVALCDCARGRIESAIHPSGQFERPLAEFAARDASQCSRWQDYRRMLEEQKLDAVVIAAPDHHHAQAMILACQAGCDVYVEKPLSLTIREGRAMVEAAQRYQRVVQVGSQQRTMEMNRFACEWIRQGGLGHVSLVEQPNYPGPLSAVRLEGEPPPDDLDWELFLGPTPAQPHHRRLWVKEEFYVGNLLWRGWDLWRSFSGHLMTNWGAHSVDMVQYALGMDESGPVQIDVQPLAATAELTQYWAAKTPPPWHDVGQADSDSSPVYPLTMRYASGTELRFCRQQLPAVFHGERGTMWMSRNKFSTDPPDLVRGGPDKEVTKKWQGAGYVARPHLENWLDCLRSRQQPNAPLESGHRTATVCHLANLARQLGRNLRWDPRRERFVDDPLADQLLDRPRRPGFELPK
jgi:predicted dehydrogenase